MAQHLQPGEHNSERLLAGRYRVHEVIGRGGMATVYRADDALLGRVVALKELAQPLAEPRRGEQLVDEARAAAALSHPHITTVYDTFEEDERRYIVMEYVAGGSLREAIDEHGPLDPDAAVDIAYQIADALDYAHRAGIIHADVKPENVLLAPNGQAKLGDFGIARAAAETWALATTIVGSAAYLAPEQVEGRRADQRSDLYSLGLVLYEMLTGKLPFEAATPAALAAQRLVREPVPVRIHAPAVPHALEGIVMRCIARNPSARYETAWDLGAALDAYREGGPPEGSRRAAQLAEDGGFEGDEEHRPISWRTRLLVIALALLAFSIAAAFVPVLLDSFDSGDGGGGSRSGGGPAPAFLPTATPSPPSSSPTATPAPARTASPTPTFVNPFGGTPVPTATAGPPRTATPSPTATRLPEAGRPTPPP